VKTCSLAFDRNKAQHTPGPWTVQPLITPDQDDDPMGVYTIEPAATDLTGRYFRSEPETPELEAVHAENRANANLIAAAPELLETLEQIYARRECDDLIVFVTRAEAVIARAKDAS